MGLSDAEHRELERRGVCPKTAKPMVRRARVYCLAEWCTASAIVSRSLWSEAVGLLAATLDRLAGGIPLER